MIKDFSEGDPILLRQQQIKDFYDFARPQSVDAILYGMQASPETGQKQHVYFPGSAEERNRYASWFSKNIEGGLPGGFDAVNFEGKDRPDEFSVPRQLKRDAKEVKVKGKDVIDSENSIKKLIKQRADEWVKSELKRLSDGGAMSYTEGSTPGALPSRDGPAISPYKNNPQEAGVVAKMKAKAGRGVNYTTRGVSTPAGAGIVGAALSMPHGSQIAAEELARFERATGRRATLAEEAAIMGGGLGTAILDGATFGLYEGITRGPQYSPNVAWLMEKVLPGSTSGWGPQR